MTERASSPPAAPRPGLLSGWRAASLLLLLGLVALGSARVYAAPFTGKKVSKSAVTTSASAGAGASPGAWVNGTKYTMYGSGDGGACGWDVLPLPDQVPFDGYVAAGADLWDGGRGCGRFLEIEGGTASACAMPGSVHPGSRIVVIADHCPECTNTHLDLTQPVWQQVTDNPPCYIADARYREVQGTWTGTITLRPKSGSSAHWYGMYVEHNNQLIEALAFRGAGSSQWVEAQHVHNQGFHVVTPPSPLALPLSVRMTSPSGQVIEAVDVVTSFTGTFDTGVQFRDGGTIHVTSVAKPLGRSWRATISGAEAAIAKVEFRVIGAKGWQLARLVDGVYIMKSRTRLRTPMSLRFTSARGEIVVAPNAITKLGRGQTSNTGAQFVCTQSVESSCADGVDNDCDGAVDSNDADC